jgi:molecular chaperone HscB
VDAQQLERHYKRLQWNVHPDKLVHKPVEERGFSEQHASNINHAYSVLKAPLARANYMVGHTRPCALT